MNVESRKIVLRGFSDLDFNDVFEYITDKDVMKYLDLNKGKPFAKDEASDYFNKYLLDEKSSALAIVLKSENKTIGQLALREYAPKCYEIVWIVNKKYWGLGYTYEITEELIYQLAQDFMFEKIVLFIKKDNVQAIELAKKLEFFSEKMENDVFEFVRYK